MSRPSAANLAAGETLTRPWESAPDSRIFATTDHGRIDVFDGAQWSELRGRLLEYSSVDVSRDVVVFGGIGGPDVLVRPGPFQDLLAPP